MASRKQCLEYIKNTNGGATVEDFIDDWAPIGEMEWDLLKASDLAEANERGIIVLTAAGVAKLNELKGSN